MILDLSDVIAHSADQGKGAWFDVLDPVTAETTGIRVLVAGPDSLVQHRAQLELFDEMAELADVDGRVSAEQREKARLRALAKAVLGWEIVEDGQPVPFNTANVLRVLRAARWLRDQVDDFAGRRPKITSITRG